MSVSYYAININHDPSHDPIYDPKRQMTQLHDPRRHDPTHDPMYDPNNPHPTWGTKLWPKEP
eukprot:5104545-Amphidinium_carterae.1